MAGGHGPTALSLAGLVRGELLLVEAGRPVTSRETACLSVSTRGLLHNLGEFLLQQGLLLLVADYEPAVLAARCFSLG